jgi:CPA1 family monovalent cation:H+ antiporter
LLATSLDEHQLTEFAAVRLLAKVISSSLIIGAITARLTIFVLKIIPATFTNIIITCLVIAFGGFYLVVHIFHVSR